jgi:signal transduction histidine kinase
MNSASPSAHVSVAAKPARIESSVAATWIRRLVLLLAAGLSVATLVLIVLSWSSEAPSFGSSRLNDSLLILALLPYPVVGMMILRSRPGNRVGWVLLLAGLGWIAQLFSHHYANFGDSATPGALPGALWLYWVSLWLVIPAFGLTFVYLPLLYPDGRLPTRWHRITARFAAVALTFAALTWATDPNPGSLAVPNPAGVDWVGQLGLNEWGWGLVFLSVVASVVAAVIRYRRAVDPERRQLQWFAYAAAIVGLTIVLATVSSDWEPARVAAEVLFPVAIASIPTAAFVAIFKYDLYDLGSVVSQTITFGLLAVLITAVYALIAVGVGSMVGGESDVLLAVVATTVVALVFQPGRIYLHGLARRFVYGERADPYDVLAELAHRMGTAPSQETILPEMAQLVAEGTGARRVELWLVIGHEMRRVASWPGGLSGRAVPLDDKYPALPGASHSVEIRSPERLLGAISLDLVPGQNLNPTEQRLVTDLAAQAGLMFDNIRLVEELKASRQRIVTAQDTERRRLERDIHDGVQQGLLSLTLTLRREAAEFAEDADGETARRLNAAADDARVVLEELRGISRGIHPAIVTEGGLAAALVSLCDRSPITARLETAHLGDLPLPVEITIYYVVAEGLANATKHSSGTHIDVVVRRRDGMVRVDVADDGVGGANSAGTGLTGLADRVSALGGDLVVHSEPTRGTRLQAKIPCELS